MRRLLLALLMLLPIAASAQFNGCPSGFCATPVVAVTGGYVGPGDINGTAYGFWGLRAYNRAYATGSNPAIDIVDQAGANPLTVNILANGSLDVATINTWVTAHTVTQILVTTVYDQSGTGNHLTAGGASRPVLTLNAIGSLPGMTFNAVSTGMVKSTPSAGPAQPLTVSFVAKRTTTSATYQAVFGGVGLQTGFDTTNNALYVFAGSLPTPLAAFDNVFHAVQSVFNTTTSTISADGTTSGPLSVGAADLTTATFLAMGQDTAFGGNGLKGVVLEMGAWAGNKSANTVAMNVNQRTYWGLYVGPGDVAPGASDWWGLRAYSLYTAGSKSALICNAGDANCADINTLGNGDFDIATATGAPLNCGGAGGTCTVKKLYTKTGSTNCSGGPCDLGQNTIANRPTLVTSCTGGKPCMACLASSSQVLANGNRSTPLSTFTVSAVAIRNAAFTTSGTIWGNDSGGPNQLGFTASANTIGMYSGVSVTAAATDSVFHSVQGIFNGATSDLFVDNVSSTGNAGGSPASGADNICSVGSSGGFQYMTGRVTEVGIWPSALNPVQKTNMSANQHTYWGF